MQRRRKLIDFLRVAARAEPVRDHAVVARRVREHFRGEPAPEFERGAVVAVQRFEQPSVVGRIDDRGDEFMVFRRRAQHRRTADVDVFDGFVHRAVGRGGGQFERIQIHDQQIDARDVVLSS